MNFHPQPLVFLCLSISDFLTDSYIENIGKCRSQRAQSRSSFPSPPGSGYVLAVQWKATRSTDIFTAGTSYSFLAKGRGHQAPHVPSLFLGIFYIFFSKTPLGSKAPSARDSWPAEGATCHRVESRQRVFTDQRGGLAAVRKSVAKHAEILTVSAWQAEVEAPSWVKAGQLVLGEIYYHSLCH